MLLNQKRYEEADQKILGRSPLVIRSLCIEDSKLCLLVIFSTEDLPTQRKEQGCLVQFCRGRETLFFCWRLFSVTGYQGISPWIFCDHLTLRNVGLSLWWWSATWFACGRTKLRLPPGEGLRVRRHWSCQNSTDHETSYFCLCPARHRNLWSFSLACSPRASQLLKCMRRWHLVSLSMRQGFCIKTWIDCNLHNEHGLFCRTQRLWETSSRRHPLFF